MRSYPGWKPFSTRTCEYVNPRAAPVARIHSTLTSSALICTFGRPDMVASAVRSILKHGVGLGELIVVDQSVDDLTQRALAEFDVDPRFRYIHSATQGKGSALNLGLSQARGDIVAISDDDCVVHENWLGGLLDAFRRFSGVAVVYGEVLAAPYDRRHGFIPVYAVKRERLCRTALQKMLMRGIGANMAVRRDIALKIGGFDSELGPGGRFRACVDGDMTLRCVLAGFEVCETPASTVTHLGFRNWDAGRVLTRNAYLGIGAAYVKPIRCGRWSALPVLVYEFVFQAVVPSVWSTLTFRRPTGWSRVAHFLKGAAAGWRSPIDCSTLRYISPNDTPAT